MTGQELREARERLGWTRRQLADALNAALGTDYNPDRTVGRWERDERKVPDTVRSFVREIEMETVLPGEPGAPILDDVVDAPPAPPGEDSMPPPPEGAEVGQRPLPGGGGHARVCEELWEMVATACGMAGVVLNSDALKADRDTILADKQALGRAWGKLAETNDTFRRMLLGMTGGGAWLEVALVTGITAGKIQRNHQTAREQARAQAQEEAARMRLVDDDVPEGAMVGDSGVVIFPTA